MPPLREVIEAGWDTSYGSILLGTAFALRYAFEKAFDITEGYAYLAAAIVVLTFDLLTSKIYAED